MNIKDKMESFMFGVTNMVQIPKLVEVCLQTTGESSRKPYNLLELTSCIMFDIRNGHIINDKGR